ncbi:hypothetical protein ACWENR_15015 [Micromonospora sp. NPDC004336]
MLTGVTPLRIIKGDATSPQAKGPKVIAHVCNDAGGWGKGFVLAVSRRWPQPERCLTSLADHAQALAASVHMPRIGCGLAGGTWTRMEPIVVRTLCERDIAVTVYDR